MTQTRYFSINHEEAFRTCLLHGAEPRGDALWIDGDNGMLITPVMDCGEQGNRWQRLLADMDVPAGASVRWRFFATDLAYEMQKMDETLRNDTLTPESKLEALRPFENFSIDNADDFLLNGLRSRYVTAAFIITKPEHSPPVVIRSIQIYCAWESFLPYLPEIFRDKGGFLDHFLKLLSVPYLDLEKRIDELPDTFDPGVAPRDTLIWLAEVVGIPHIGLWETENLRKLLVTGLYRKKGRLSALGELIQQFTGFRPYVAENFRMLTGAEENDRHYQNGDLSLFMPPEASGADINMDALHLVIQSFLPSGVTYCIQILDAYPVLSGHAYLGINTSLGRYRDAALGVNSRLNYVILGGEGHGRAGDVSLR